MLTLLRSALLVLLLALAGLELARFVLGLLDLAACFALFCLLALLAMAC